MINHHHFWWRFFPQKELTQVYFSAALRSFSLSLLAIFVPLYLFQNRGFSLGQTLLFFVFYSVMFAVCTPLSASFASRFGLKHSILMAGPLYLLFLASLYFLSNTPLLLVAASSFLGASQAFYWMGLHLVFYHVSHPRHRGEEVGIRAGTAVIATIFGPLLGGVVITFFGFKILFMITALLLLGSALFLFLSKEEYEQYHFSVRSMFDKRSWKNSLFFISRGTYVSAEGVIWPLLIFSILGSYISMGLVGSLMSLSSGVLFWATGKYTDQHANRRKIIRWSTFGNSVILVGQSMVTTAAQVFAVSILFSFTNALREAPIGALEYDKAKGQVAAYFVSREVFICLGRILLLGLVLMTNSLSGGMVFQAFANFGAFLF